MRYRPAHRCTRSMRHLEMRQLWWRRQGAAQLRRISTRMRRIPRHRSLQCRAVFAIARRCRERCFPPDIIPGEVFSHIHNVVPGVPRQIMAAPTRGVESPIAPINAPLEIVRLEGGGRDRLVEETRPMADGVHHEHGRGELGRGRHGTARHDMRKKGRDGRGHGPREAAVTQRATPERVACQSHAGRVPLPRESPGTSGRMRPHVAQG